MISDRAREGFAVALEGHPFNSVDSLAEEVAQGAAFVWSGASADVFTRIHMVERVCEMGPVAGDKQEMLTQALPQIEAWARGNDCTDLYAQAGRIGWARELKPYGFEVVGVILRKKL